MPASSPLLAATPAFAAALVVDDHPLFCDALAMTLARGRGRRAHRDGRQPRRRARPARRRGGAFDLVVLDLNLPDVSGLDGLIRLRAAARGAPVVVVSSIAEPRVIAAAIRAGAAGFVPKHSPRETFREALAAIARGRALRARGGGRSRTPPPARARRSWRRLAALTRQQARILELICEGKLNKQIAWDLGVADATVKAHVTAIMRKLGVQTRTQAVLLAREVSFSSLLHG